MQKILRRTALAKRQHGRECARETALKKKAEKATIRQTNIAINKSIHKDVKAERRARREDWFLGALAPRRDVGENARTYGALEPMRLRAAEKHIYKEWGIAVGDRVVVVKKGHRDEGKIGVVSDVGKKREQCTVAGLNRTNVALPEYMLIREADKTPIRVYPLPFSMSEVRVVAKLTQPETGTYRDVIVNELEVVEEHYKYGQGLIPRERFIAGLTPKTKVPFPDTPKVEHEDNDCDSLRIEVEEQTWTPTLREPPMPSSIIDELRHKYGKMRTRHDDDWIEKVERAAREPIERKKALARQVVSPLQEFNRKQRAEKRALGRPKLSDGMLEKIGQVMASRSEKDIPKGL